MLDPRIYRTGLAAVVLAVIVFAFSFQGQPGALGGTLPPAAFNGQSAYAAAMNLARHYVRRPAGGANDTAIAAQVSQGLRQNHFSVSTQSFKAATPNGTRGLQNVIGVRTGLSNSSIVVVAHRDDVGPPTSTGESGTGVLLDLASVLSGETLNHTVVLVSTTGATGAAGASQLIPSLPGPVDAVLVLGDMATPALRSPFVVPWSDGQQVAPPLLRNTVASALTSQSGLQAGGTSLAGQFAHLAFPLTVSEQGAFNAHGIPAVLLAATGEHPTMPGQPASLNQITQFGTAALEAISALDSSNSVPPPSAYVLFNGNVVPAWAIRILVLGLILPVLMTTIDGFARARRRGHAVGRWMIRLLAMAVPFVLAAAIVLLAKAFGVLDISPPAATAAGAIALGTKGTVLLSLLLAVVAVSLWLLRKVRVISVAGGDAGATMALMLLMCGLSLAVWIFNPFAAALLVPALHLWLWGLTSQTRMHPAARMTIFALGLAPPFLVLTYYVVSLGFSPITFAWTVVLMIAGGQIGTLALLAASILMGCAVGGAVIGPWGSRRERGETETSAVTVRGPVTYAGPGSLGGTESALRR